MKKLIFLIVALLPLVGLQAQNFTVVNSDGVSINYSVVSTTDHTVALAQGTYTGHVVVPETVEYNGVTWTVASMQNEVFYNSSVTYVRLPGTIHALGSRTFRGCTQLDSLRFDSEQPLAVTGGYAVSFGTTFPFSTLPVYVPCGHLSEWKGAQIWNRFAKLTSSCAYKLSVIPSRDSLVRVDSIEVNNIPVYSSGFYEAGDTAVLRMTPLTWKVGGITHYARRSIFYGWSDGSTQSVHSYVMPAHNDTVICHIDTMHYSVLSASRITTPVFQFGTLSYDDYSANYSFRDIPNASTIYATSMWVGSGEHVAAARFMSNGYDYFPGPLRITDATSSMETTMRFSRVWHLTREMIDYHVAHCGDAGYVPADDILTWPGNGDVEDGYAQKLAPYYDADGNGYYNAYAGDYPLIRGDECVFSIFNDAYGIHGESEGEALGVEVHAMTYAFNEPQDTALWNTVFVHYDVYNRSATTYDSTYFGAWTDFDIGYAWDDYVGCDVKDGMYFGYNGMQNDSPGTGSFTGVTPAQGCMILGGALVDADGRDNLKVDIDKILTEGYTNLSVKNLLAQYLRSDGTYDTVSITRDAELFYSYDPYSWYFQPDDETGNLAINGIGFGDGVVDNERIGMTCFIFYENSTNSICGEPQQASDYYNYMRGYWKNGQHIKYGGNAVSTATTNIDCNYMFPGDTDPWYWGTNGVAPQTAPWDQTTWDFSTAGNNPQDVRGIGASGPFTFVAGSCQQLDLAYVTGFGEVDNWSSVADLWVRGRSVRRQYVRDTTDSGRPFVHMPYSAPHPVGIDEVAQSRLTVYPNPTTGMLTVALPVAADVRLYDMMGRCVMTVPAATPNVTLDLGNLPQGIYLLRAAGAVQRVVKK